MKAYAREEVIMYIVPANPLFLITMYKLSIIRSGLLTLIVPRLYRLSLLILAF